MKQIPFNLHSLEEKEYWFYIKLSRDDWPPHKEDGPYYFDIDIGIMLWGLYGELYE